MRKQKKWKFFIVIMALPLIISCSKDDGESHDSGITVKLTQENLTEYGYFDGILYYKITSNSPREVMVNKAESSAINVETPSSVNIEGANYNCTSIGEKAFYGHKNMKTLTISNSVKSIGQRAFQGCYGLTSVTIPNSVTYIDQRAFQGCYGLTSVTIPQNVTSINEFTFDGCQGLISITIPNSVTSIGGHAFEECTSLTSITIPNSVTSIGNQAFYGCSNLTSITIPNSVISIGDQAFYGCTGLTSIVLNTPESSESNVYDLPKEPIGLVVSQPNYAGLPVDVSYTIQISLTNYDYSWIELGQTYSSSYIQVKGIEMNNATMSAYHDAYNKYPEDNLPVFVRIHASPSNYSNCFQDSFSDAIQIKVRAYEPYIYDSTGFERDDYNDDKNI